MRNDETSKVLISMLTENTGRHMLDSGGAYGRHWERNQGRDFEAEDHASVEFRTWGADREIEVSISKSTFHYLNEHLEFDAEMDQRLQAIIDESDRYTSYGEDIETFFDTLDPDLLSGPEGDGKPYGDNSYNHESLLDQTIQYTYFDYDGDPYVILQIHGGCDVRGGYTAPRVFKMSDSFALNFDCDASIDCPECRAYWSTDDGYHMYFEGSSRDSEYDFKSMIPFNADDYDDSESTFGEYTIKRFGLPFYNMWADRIDRVKVAVYRAKLLPQKLVKRVTDWASSPVYDKSRAVLRVRGYRVLGKYRMSHSWRYPIRSPRVLEYAREIGKRLMPRKPNLCKRYLVIDADHNATCPVCGKGTLTAY